VSARVFCPLSSGLPSGSSEVTRASADSASPSAVLGRPAGLATKQSGADSVKCPGTAS
jgi:hypothetical protein